MYIGLERVECSEALSSESNWAIASDLHEGKIGFKRLVPLQWLSYTPDHSCEIPCDSLGGMELKQQ